MPLIRLMLERFGDAGTSTTFEQIESAQQLKELVDCLHSFFRDYKGIYTRDEEMGLYSAFSGASYKFFSRASIEEMHYAHLSSSLGLDFTTKIDLLNKLESNFYGYPLHMGFRAWLGILNFENLEFDETELKDIYLALRPMVQFANKKLYEGDDQSQDY